MIQLFYLLFMNVRIMQSDTMYKNIFDYNSVVCETNEAYGWHVNKR